MSTKEKSRRQSKRIAGGVLAAVGPYVVASFIRIALFEEPLPQERMREHVFHAYLRPAWVELIVVTAALAVGASVVSTGLTDAKGGIQRSLSTVLGIFFACLILVFGIPKLWTVPEIVTVWIPILMCLAVLALTVAWLTPSD